MSDAWTAADPQTAQPAEPPTAGWAHTAEPPGKPAAKPSAKPSAKHSHWTSPYTEEFGRQIGHRRVARGWSQRQLGEVAGVKQSLITHIELGDHGPSLTTAYRLAKALGVDLPLLLIEIQAALLDRETAA